jgi:hypothetical protein
MPLFEAFAQRYSRPGSQPEFRELDTGFWILDGKGVRKKYFVVPKENT